ncbi:MAG: hypothetical protein ACLQLC_02865 [Candidatus Sulfotelmatobacter sp.]
MDYTGLGQRLVDLDGSTSNNNPGPLRMVIRKFPRYSKQLNTLPIDENIRLAVVADFIAASYQPGCLPILGVRLIGHADQDIQRGPQFEQQISEDRARVVEARLREDVAKRTWTFNIVATMPNPNVPRPTAIRWVSTGVGATQPDEENVRRHKTPENMSEEDRKLNRRVEIILEPGITPVPQEDADLIIANVLSDWAKANRPAIPPMGPPTNPSAPKWIWHFLAPPKPDEWVALKSKIKDALKNVDIETAIETIKDRLMPDAPSKGWQDDLRSLVDELEKARADGQKEWWKDDD